MRVSAGCRCITSVFLESFPSPLVLISTLPHYFILCHSLWPTSARKANGDSEFSMLFVYPRHEKAFAMVFSLCNGKAGKNRVPCGLEPTVAEADLLWNFQLQAKRGESSGHTWNTGMHTYTCTLKNTLGLPSNWYAPGYKPQFHPLSTCWICEGDLFFFSLTLS